MIFLFNVVLHFEQYYILHMRCVGEHIHWLHFLHAVCHIECLQIACLCGWVAAHINDAFRVCSKYCLYHVGVHSGAWWVGDNHIRASMACYEFVVEYVFHVAGIELCVADAVLL